MRLNLFVCLSALLMLAAATARGGPERPAPAPAAGESAAAALERLDKAYQEARSAYFKAASEQRARRKEEPDVVLPRLVYPDPEYVTRFREEARRHAGSPQSTTFLIRAFGLSYRTDIVAAKEILAEILDGHMKSEQLPEIASKLLIGAHVTYLGRDTVVKAINRVIDESPHDVVKVVFLYTRSSLVNRSRTSTAEERAGAVQDLDRAIELGAGTPYPALAERMKHELLNLQVGLPAPEIEGRDLDGVAFKLSDYRGQVVVLDFWGDW